MHARPALRSFHKQGAARLARRGLRGASGPGDGARHRNTGHLRRRLKPSERTRKPIQALPRCLQRTARAQGQRRRRGFGAPTGRRTPGSSTVSSKQLRLVLRSCVSGSTRKPRLRAPAPDQRRGNADLPWLSPETNTGFHPFRPTRLSGIVERVRCRASGGMLGRSAARLSHASPSAHQRRGDAQGRQHRNALDTPSVPVPRRSRHLRRRTQSLTAATPLRTSIARLRWCKSWNSSHASRGYLRP